MAEKYKSILPLAISTLALLVSIASAWNSYIIRMRSRAPNVQLWDVSTTRTHLFEGDDGTLKMAIVSEINLRNSGDAATQIANIKIEDESLETARHEGIEFFITGTDTKTVSNFDNLIEAGVVAPIDKPILGVSYREIGPNEIFYLEIIIITEATSMSSGSQVIQDSIYSNALQFLTITFSDGKSLTFSPVPFYLSNATPPPTPIE